MNYAGISFVFVVGVLAVFAVFHENFAKIRGIVRFMFTPVCLCCGGWVEEHDDYYCQKCQDGACPVNENEAVNG